MAHIILYGPDNMTHNYPDAKHQKLPGSYDRGYPIKNHEKYATYCMLLNPQKHFIS